MAVDMDEFDRPPEGSSRRLTLSKGNGAPTKKKNKMPKNAPSLGANTLKSRPESTNALPTTLHTQRQAKPVIATGNETDSLSGYLTATTRQQDIDHQLSSENNPNPMLTPTHNLEGSHQPSPHHQRLNVGFEGQSTASMHRSPSNSTYDNPPATPDFDSHSPGAGMTTTTTTAHGATPSGTDSLSTRQSMTATSPQDQSPTKHTWEDIPVGAPSKPRSFEDILREQLQESGQPPAVQVPSTGNFDTTSAPGRQATPVQSSNYDGSSRQAQDAYSHDPAPTFLGAKSDNQPDSHIDNAEMHHHRDDHNSQLGGTTAASDDYSPPSPPSSVSNPPPTHESRVANDEKKPEQRQSRPEATRHRSRPSQSRDLDVDGPAQPSTDASSRNANEEKKAPVKKPFLRKGTRNARTVIPPKGAKAPPPSKQDQEAPPPPASTTSTSRTTARKKQSTESKQSKSKGASNAAAKSAPSRQSTTSSSATAGVVDPLDEFQELERTVQTGRNPNTRPMYGDSSDDDSHYDDDDDGDGDGGGEVGDGGYAPHFNDQPAPVSGGRHRKGSQFDDDDEWGDLDDEEGPTAFPIVPSYSQLYSAKPDSPRRFPQRGDVSPSSPPPSFGRERDLPRSPAGSSAAHKPTPSKLMETIFQSQPPRSRQQAQQRQLDHVMPREDKMHSSATSGPARTRASTSGGKSGGYSKQYQDKSANGVGRPFTQREGNLGPAGGQGQVLGSDNSHGQQDRHQSPLIQEKMEALDREISKFQAETRKLKDLQAQVEAERKLHQDEMDEFDHWKLKEEEKMAEEQKKLRKEKKLWERQYARTQVSRANDKKEREEIELLKKEIEKLNEKSRGKDAKWKVTCDRLKSKIQTLTERNQSLEEEVLRYEEMRLNHWVDSESEHSQQQQQHHNQHRGHHREQAETAVPQTNRHRAQTNDVPTRIKSMLKQGNKNGSSAVVDRRNPQILLKTARSSLFDGPSATTQQHSMERERRDGGGRALATAGHDGGYMGVARQPVPHSQHHAEQIEDDDDDDDDDDDAEVFDGRQQQRQHMEATGYGICDEEEEDGGGDHYEEAMEAHEHVYSSPHDLGRRDAHEHMDEAHTSAERAVTPDFHSLFPNIPKFEPVSDNMDDILSRLEPVKFRGVEALLSSNKKTHTAQAQRPEQPQTCQEIHPNGSDAHSPPHVSPPSSRIHDQVGGVQLFDEQEELGADVVGVEGSVEGSPLPQSHSADVSVASSRLDTSGERGSPLSQSLSGVPTPARDNVTSVLKSCQPGEVVTSKVVHADGKVTMAFSSGRKCVVFPNGTRKEVLADGSSHVYFTNGDVKKSFGDGGVSYFYADAQTTQTTYPNGEEHIEFANGQIETHLADGRKEILFPDGTVKYVDTMGREETVYPDGTVERVDEHGGRLVQLSPSPAAHVFTA